MSARTILGLSEPRSCESTGYDSPRPIPRQGRQSQVSPSENPLRERGKVGRAVLITTPGLLELIWVLSAVYDFTRSELLEAIHLLSQMPILDFEDFELVTRLIRLGGEIAADMSDLVIGLAGGARGCESTLTFERGLEKTGLFERR